jgi:hypothetical protein
MKNEFTPLIVPMGGKPGFALNYLGTTLSRVLTYCWRR